MNQHIEPHDTDCDDDIYHVMTPSPAVTSAVLSTDSGEPISAHAQSSLKTIENQELTGGNTVSSSPEPGTFNDTAPHITSECVQTASDGADSPGFVQISKDYCYDSK